MNIEQYFEKRQLSPIERLKHTHPLILAQTSPPLLETVNDNDIVCPFCKNSLEGIIVIKTSNGYKYKCPHCATSFTNADFARIHFGDKADYTDEALKLIDAVDDSVYFSPKSIKDFMSFYKKCNSQLADFINSQGGTWRGLSIKTLQSFYAGFVPDFGDNASPHIIIPSDNFAFSACLADKPHIYCFGYSSIFGFQKLQEYVADVRADNQLLSDECFSNYFDPVFIVDNPLDAVSGIQLSNYRFISINNFELEQPIIDLLNSLNADIPFIVICPPDSENIPDIVKKLRHACPRHTFAHVPFRDISKWTDDFHKAKAKFIITSPDELPLIDYLRDKDNNPVTSVNQALQLCPESLKSFFTLIFDETKKYMQICFDEGEKGRHFEKADDNLNMEKAQHFFDNKQKSDFDSFDERNKYHARFTPSISDDELNAVNNMSKDAINNLKLQIKSADPEKVFIPASHSGVVCPHCGSGSGRNGTGMAVTPSTNGGWRFKCWACGELQGDLLEIIATVNHLDLSKDFKKVLAIGKKIVENAYNLNFDDIKFDNIKIIAGNDGCSVEELKLIEDDIKKAQANIDNLPEIDRRGLSLDTLKRYHIGYIDKLIHPKTRLKKSPDELAKIPASPYIVIPTAPRNCFHYVAVLTPSARNEHNKDFRVMHAGKKEPYILNNGVDLKIQKRLIIVEGEIDALSISQALNHSELVVAVGGAAEGKKILEQLNRVFETPESRADFIPIIIFDNDDTGIKKSRELRGLFLKNGYPAYSAFLVDDPNFKIDANDILIGGGNKSQIKAILEEKFSIGTYGGQAVLKSLLDDIIKNAQAELPNNLDAIKNLQANKNEDVPFTPPQMYSSALTTKDAIPSCPVDLQIPSGYGIDEYSINSNQVPFCYTPVVIKAFLTDTVSGMFYTQLAYYNKMKKCWCDNVIIQNSVLADSRKIISLADYGIAFNSKSAKNLSTFLLNMSVIDKNRQKIPQINLQNFTGWLVTYDDDDNELSDFKNFIFPTAKLQYGEHILKNAHNNYAGKFVKKGNKNLWRQKINELYDACGQNGFRGGAFLVSLGLSLAAPLLRILGKRNLQLLLWAKTGSGKSALIKLAMSVWGNPESLKNTFNATRNAIDETTALYNDLPIWIDEFQSAKKDVREEIDNIIYNYTEGKLRTRLYRTGEYQNRPKAFKGVRLMTSEQPILTSKSNAGAFNRLLTVNNSNLFPDGYNISELHSFLEENFGFIARDWIAFIIENVDLIKQQYPKTYAMITEYFDDRNWNDNWLQFFAVVVTALYIAFKHFGLIDNYVASKFTMKIVAAIDELAEDVPVKTSISNSERAQMALEDYIVANPKNFRKADVAPNEEFTPLLCQGYIFRDGSVGFLPNQFKFIVENELGFLSAKAILAEFDEKKLLRYSPKTKRKLQAFKHINSEHMRGHYLYLFKPEAFSPQDEALDDDV